MSTIVVILMGAAMLITLGVLAAGLVTMVRRGSDAGMASNKLMQLRVTFQAMAIGLFVLAMLLR
jgi:hypothetical protein